MPKILPLEITLCIGLEKHSLWHFTTWFKSWLLRVFADNFGHINELCAAVLSWFMPLQCDIIATFKKVDLSQLLD